MTRLIRPTFAFLFVATFLGHAYAEDNAKSLEKLFHDDWEFQMREYPTRANWIGDERYSSALTDLSPEAIKRRKEHDVEILKLIKSTRAEGLSKQDLLSRELFLWEAEAAVLGHQFPSEVFALDQLDGPQFLPATFAQMMRFRRAEDYQNYLTRLRAYPKYLGQIESLLERGIELRWVQPKIALRAVPDQISNLIAMEPTQSPLFLPFKSFPPAMSQDEKDKLSAEAKQAITNDVFPAMAKFREFVVGSYLPLGDRPVGVSNINNGKEYYKNAVRRFTTTDLSPEEIHEIGKSEVARIRLKMEEVIKKSGFQGSFAEFLNFLRTDSRFYYTKPEELLAGFRDISKRIDAELPKLFEELPRNPYGVKPFPDYEAPNQTSARYYPGAADGTRAGFFMANTYKLSARPKYEMEALTLHEAVPGHHLQISRAQELHNLPNFRRNGEYTVFVEGWALYAESLGEEVGFYADPYSKFGQLTFEIWRACRLVVDTGMHALGWTREQAINYLKDNSAKSILEIEVEIDRYIVWPGQALAYKIGELKIKELRKRAEKELGKKFDVRSFHNAVLDNGPLPLPLLEKEISAWIAKVQESK